MDILKIRLSVSIFALLLITNLTFGQSFEGTITYKVEMLNPSKKMFPDSVWQEKLKEQFGDRGYKVQKYYYKKGDYMSEFDAGKEKGFQAFNPKNKLLYSWQLNSDTAVSIDSRKSFDELVEIKESDKKDTIMGIVCKCIIVKTQMSKMTLYYNPNYFKMDPNFYKGHVYGQWEAILKKIGCIPIKMEMKVLMINMVQTMIDYKDTTIDIKKFEIPKFKEVIKDPIN